MWKLGLRPRNPFSGNIFFEFSVLCLCSVRYRSRGRFYARRSRAGGVSSLLRWATAMRITGQVKTHSIQAKKNPMGKKLNTFMSGQSICLSWCMLACLLPSSSCFLPSSSCVLPSFCCLLPSRSCVLPTRFPLPSQAICCSLPSFSLSAWSCTVTYWIGTKNISGFLEKRSRENYNY